MRQPPEDLGLTNELVVLAGVKKGTRSKPLGNHIWSLQG
jgi:hypothetical protein